MTKVPDSLKDTGDVEVTPEMIEAGEDAYDDWYCDGGLDDGRVAMLAKLIYGAMSRVAADSPTNPKDAR